MHDEDANTTLVDIGELIDSDLENKENIDPTAMNNLKDSEAQKTHRICSSSFMTLL